MKPVFQGALRAALLTIVLSGLFSPSVELHAAPLSPAELPRMLQDWLPWAQQGHEEETCPRRHDGNAERECLWPARLALQAGASGASFRYEVEVFGKALLVPLPGEATAWPQEVKSGSRALAVVNQGGRPATLLPPGRHLIEGQIPWRQMPQDLLLPSNLAALQLQVDGVTLNRSANAEGRVWLRQTQQAAQQSDGLTLNTVRLLDDQIPLRLHSHYELSVAGKAREITLPLALLPGWTAEQIDSLLPVRLQDDGRLIIQARPGRWQITVSGRLMQPAQDLTLPKAEGASAEEVWAVAAHNELRLIRVDGPASVDPKQVEMPNDWRQYPAYRMRPGDQIRLLQSRRGNAQPEPDELKLRRQLWLDFDGGGYTVHDEIQGKLSRSTRLEAAAPLQLGSASVNGQEQTITRQRGDGPAGVELRDLSATLHADSRIEGGTRDFSAAGWQSDFSALTVALALPPGWQLLHAGGVDSVSGSWVAQWTLWDMFFLLLASLAAARLLGWRSGLLLAAALGLSWHQATAPGLPIWLLLLALLGLKQVLPVASKASRIAARGHALAAFALALLLLPHAVTQLRLCLYPVLETPASRFQREAVPAAAPAVTLPPDVQVEAAPDQAAAPPPHAPLPVLSNVREVKASVMAVSKPRPPGDAPPSRPEQIDPSARVQTGPGLPRWNWHSYSLNWQGPVRQDQALSLWLLPPWATVIWRLLSLGLLLAALARLAGVKRGQHGADGEGHSLWPQTRPARFESTAALLLALSLGGLLLTPPSAEAAPAAQAKPDPAASSSSSLPPPSKELLDELRARLDPPPPCLPQCAELARGLLSATGSKLQLRLELHALAEVAVPLPGQGNHWQPSQILLDGKTATTRRDAQGQLWLLAPRGVSQLLLEADAGNASSVDISLPLPLRELKSQLQGWSLAGADARGQYASAISLLREQDISASSKGDGASLRDSLPPLVQIERRLQLGLQWSVETRIRRLAPSRAPLQVRYALLAGEAINDASVRVENGEAVLQLGGEEERQVQSSLAIAPQLRLKSSSAPQQIERWVLNAAPQWHLSLAGIPPIQHGEAGQWAPAWQPWPGESVELNIVKPAGVDGQTLTLDSAQTTVKPGLRASDYELQARLRTSLGGQQKITLPEGAELLAISVDGNTLPLQAQDRVLNVPLTPGEHLLTLRWREPQGMGLLFRNSPLQLGSAGVNDTLQIQLPEDRLVLALGGPLMGPAVLIWGVIAALLLASWALGRWGTGAGLHSLPLRAPGWLLLGLGLAPVSLGGLAVLLAWFVLLQQRQRWAGQMSRWAWMAAQLGLLLLTLAATTVLLDVLRTGLLGYPDLMIRGNESSSHLLRWYADRFGSQTAQAWVISVPLLAYRIAMLLWALWLAASVLNWLRWAWACFSSGGLWPEKLAIPAKRSGKPTD
ncbi:hypothetical protein RQP53_20475 [Paucibacter sp. APW11]|uniref:Uncharacterized protein n=1 Tax=Roseateles aquae TaxID=3077235 RepID=A0ABU3PGR5_9BURK|nr:hypothetical protein [Paucibacter sp. APW11]MDT9001664.1 hypothetical protein [Paucibacter sp. APW11]